MKFVSFIKRNLLKIRTVYSLFWVSNLFLKYLMTHLSLFAAFFFSSFFTMNWHFCFVFITKFLIFLFVCLFIYYFILSLSLSLSLSPEIDFCSCSVFGKLILTGILFFSFFFFCNKKITCIIFHLGKKISEDIKIITYSFIFLR